MVARVDHADQSVASGHLLRVRHLLLPHVQWFRQNSTQFRVGVSLGAPSGLRDASVGVGLVAGLVHQPPPLYRGRPLGMFSSVKTNPPPLRLISYPNPNQNHKNPILLHWLYSSLKLPPHLTTHVNHCAPPNATRATVVIHLYNPHSTSHAIKSIKSSPMPPNAKYVLLFDAHSIKKQSPILEFQREFPDSEVVSCGPQKHLSPREQDLIKAYVGAAGDYFVGSHHSAFSNGVALLRITQFGLRSFVYSCHTHVLYPSLTQYNELGEGCPEKSLSVVGFWHIGPGASHNLHSRESVVCSQVRESSSPIAVCTNRQLAPLHVVEHRREGKSHNHHHPHNRRRQRLARKRSTVHQN